MKVLGIVFNHNIIAVMIGLAITMTCLIIAFLFQKNLFGRYRRKVSNTADKNGANE